MANKIIEFWQTLSEWGMYQQMAVDASPVECVPMADVFNPEQLLFLKESFHAEKKQCYKNCTYMVGLISHPFGKVLGFNADEIRYVDGYVYEPGLIPIEHAFIKIGNRYVDPTFERVLKRDVRECQYVSLCELKYIELWPILEHRGFYGPLYQYIKDNPLQGKI